MRLGDESPILQRPQGGVFASHGIPVAPSNLTSAVAAKEEVAYRLAPEEGEPASSAVFLSIMLEVAPLAECHQVTWAVIRRVVVAVSGRQHHPGSADLRERV
jgi:hypothetical protein